MYAKICIIKLFKMLKFLVFFFPPNTVFSLLIIIRQESTEAALNLQYMVQIDIVSIPLSRITSLRYP